jgi:hypothetical protein
MSQRKIPRNLHDHALHIQPLSQHQSIQHIHRLRENSHLVYRMSAHSGSQNLLQRLQYLQYLLLRSLKIAWSPCQRFKSKTEENEEEGNGLVAVVDQSVVDLVRGGGEIIGC